MLFNSMILYDPINVMYIFAIWAQSFTSLKADLHQDINRGFAFSRCLNETSDLLRFWTVGFGNLTQKRRLVFVTLLIWVNIPMS